MAARAKKENAATGLSQEHPVHENQLSDLTLNYLEGRPKSERSPIGQFITPKLLRDRLLSQIEMKPGFRVLDPGVGAGEFLKSSFEVENDLYLAQQSRRRSQLPNLGMYEYSQLPQLTSGR